MWYVVPQMSLTISEYFQYQYMENLTNLIYYLSITNKIANNCFYVLLYHNSVIIYKQLFATEDLWYLMSMSLACIWSSSPLVSLCGKPVAGSMMLNLRLVDLTK